MKTRVFRVQNSCGEIIDNEYEYLVDATPYDDRRWWRKLWDWYASVEWKPEPVTVVIPAATGDVFRIKKIDDSNNPVLIVTEPIELTRQYETWSNEN